MTTIDSVLRRSLDDRSGDLILTLDPAFQGLPDTAHGGSVLAAFDALAGLTGPRHVGGVYRKRVPVGVPLALTHGRTEATHTFVLRDATSVLVDGRVAPVADTRRGAPAPLGDPLLLGVAESGMTTELAVTLRRAVPFLGALTVTGARAAARPQPDPRYWDTEVLVWTEDRTLVASARITFVVVRGAARRLVQGMLTMNDPAVVARVFPAYAR